MGHRAPPGAASAKVGCRCCSGTPTQVKSTIWLQSPPMGLTIHIEALGYPVIASGRTLRPTLPLASRHGRRPSRLPARACLAHTRPLPRSFHSGALAYPLRAGAIVGASSFMEILTAMRKAWRSRVQLRWIKGSLLGGGGALLKTWPPPPPKH